MEKRYLARQKVCYLPWDVSKTLLLRKMIVTLQTKSPCVPDFQLALVLAIGNLGIAYMPEHFARLALQKKEVRQLSNNWDEFSQQIPLMLFFRLDYAYPLIKPQLVDGLRDWFGFDTSD